MPVWILILLLSGTDPHQDGQEFATREKCMAAGDKEAARHADAIIREGTPFVCLCAPSELRRH